MSVQPFLDLSIPPQKNAVHWSRVVSLPDDGDTEDTADEEASQWAEGGSIPAGEDRQIRTMMLCSVWERS